MHRTRAHTVSQILLIVCNRMASIQRHGKKWRAFVTRQGIRRSKVFATRQEAKDWAAREEYEIQHRDRVAAGKTLKEALDRYAREVSPGKRGHRWEALRLAKIGRDRLGAIRMGDLAPHHIADWRDRRLREVAPGSVRREIGLLSAVLTVARREWQWVDRNPVADVGKPQEPPPRTRLPTEEEFARLAHVAGDDLRTAMARTHLAFLFSCETAMRSGEILGLTWDAVNIGKRVAHLPRTKNGTARDVPLSMRAVELLEALPKAEPIFALTAPQRDALWRKITSKAGIEDLHFHDARAYALTQLARRVDVLTLARISGHKDIRLLSNVYYRETAEDIAKRLG